MPAPTAQLSMKPWETESGSGAKTAQLAGGVRPQPPSLS